MAPRQLELGLLAALCHAPAYSVFSKPPSSKKALLRVSAAALVALATYMLLQSNLVPWKRSYRWRMQGAVYDTSTNALAGVTVTASGYVRWTFIDLFFGTSPRTFSAHTTTDKSGRFRLAFSGSTPTLVFQKASYAQRRFVLHYIDAGPGDPSATTDRNLQVILYREGEAPRQDPADDQ